MTELPDDIARAIARRFPDSRARAVLVLAPLLTLVEGARVARCVIHLAADLDALAHYADRARADPRDVMWWAEYDGGERRLRDFSRPLD